jgi:hypothetical protein
MIKHKDFTLALKEEADDLVGTSFGELLKFDANTSKFSIVGGDDVPLGSEYVAHCDQFARGWTKFVDKHPVGVRITKATDGKAAERSELDDLDLAGTEGDPWVFQRYLPLVNCKTGAIVTFVGKSVGSKIALGNLLLNFSGNAERGLPIVRLATGSFRSREYGRRARPDFVVIGWTGGPEPERAAVYPPAEKGPPDRSPGDPGYDPSVLDRDDDGEVPF